MIITYKKSKTGDHPITPHFKGKEFACKDGTDEVLVDTSLVFLLEKIREHFGKPLVITSGYRTKKHNAAVSGASSSQHLLGTAADFKMSGVRPLDIAKYAESLSCGGIGLYSSFVHIDTRAGRSRWDERTGTRKVISAFDQYYK